MRILAAASAFPDYYYSRATTTAALERIWGDRLRSPQRLRKLHESTQVEGRHVALPVEAYFSLKTWGEANNAWIRVAEKIGGDALCRAASRAGIPAQNIDALFFVSVTGVSSPSVDAKIINRLQLNPNIRRVPIFGLGCVAGAAGISQAADYVRAYPKKVAALVSVELCSLTLQFDDLSMANQIAAGLFGDGSAAVILAGAECPLVAAERASEGPEIIDTRSVFYPGTEDVMGWDISERGFRIVLSPTVPDVIREHLRADADAFLSTHDLTRADIGCWVMHTGGPKVLEATEDALELDRGALAVSWDCLRRMGNLSSASVLMVLEEIMMHRRPAPGTWSVLAAMGPGFCCELVLLRW